MLLFFCDGRQIGYRISAIYDYLDYAMAEAGFSGPFFLHHQAAAAVADSRQDQFDLGNPQLRQNLAYAQTFDVTRLAMAEPTRVSIKFTRTPTIVFRRRKVNDKAKRQKCTRYQSSRPEIIDELEERVNKELKARLDRSRLAARCVAVARPAPIDVQWTRAYHNPKALIKSSRGWNALFAAYRQNRSSRRLNHPHGIPTGLVWACAVKSSRCADLNGKPL